MNEAMPGLGTTITVAEAIAYVQEVEQKYDGNGPNGQILEAHQPGKDLVYVYTAMTGSQPWAVWREPDKSHPDGSFIMGEW